MDYATLKARHRAIRDNFPQSLSLRTHRALSWLNRAEQEADDGDAQFIFLWIALNAAYAINLDEQIRLRERKLLLNFLHLLIAADRERLLYDLAWGEFPNSIRLLIENKYVFQPFWEYQNERVSEEYWQESFRQSKAAAHRALGKMDTKRILAIIFERLYVLRNQLVHGGATWNSSVNRDQVRDGANLLGRLVPTIIHLMLENPDEDWGTPAYPVVD